MVSWNVDLLKWNFTIFDSATVWAIVTMCQYHLLGFPQSIYICIYIYIYIIRSKSFYLVKLRRQVVNLHIHWQVSRQMRTETSDELGWFCWVSQHSVSSPRLFSIYVDDSQDESQSLCWQDFGSPNIASVTRTRNRLFSALNLLCTWSWCSRVCSNICKRRIQSLGGKAYFYAFSVWDNVLEMSNSRRMTWARETCGRREIVVHRCFCSRKEGEVTSGGRRQTCSPHSPAGRAPTLHRPREETQK